MQPEIIVEELIWHDCPVDSITFDTRTQILDLLLDPSEEMLEALGMEYPQATKFRVTFSDVDAIGTSNQFTFFEVHKDLWGEVLHANFEERADRKICNLGVLFYRGVAQVGYGEIAFEYGRAFLNQI